MSRKPSDSRVSRRSFAAAGASPALASRIPGANDRTRLGVIVDTLDHLHSQLTVDACRAGMDVYVEKPMTSLPLQGHDMVRAVRETGRIVQVGVQQRGMERTFWNADGGYITPAPPGMEQKPAGLDWNACMGSGWRGGWAC